MQQSVITTCGGHGLTVLSSIVGVESFVLMDSIELDNWTKIAEGMEASGDTESWFYLRARAIADGKPDPMPNLSQLMPDDLT